MDTASSETKYTLATDKMITDLMSSAVNQINSNIRGFTKKVSDVASKCSMSAASVEWAALDLANLKLTKPVTYNFQRKDSVTRINENYTHVAASPQHVYQALVDATILASEAKLQRRQTVDIATLENHLEVVIPEEMERPEVLVLPKAHISQKPQDYEPMVHNDAPPRSVLSSEDEADIIGNVMVNGYKNVETASNESSLQEVIDTPPMICCKTKTISEDEQSTNGSIEQLCKPMENVLMESTSEEGTPEKTSPVIFRDVNNLSPRALSRDLTPIRDMERSEFDEIMANEAIKASLEDDHPIKPTANGLDVAKSLFESDSDDDLFRPINPRKPTSSNATTTPRNAAIFSDTVTKTVPLNDKPSEKPKSIFFDSSSDEEDIEKLFASKKTVQQVLKQAPKDPEMEVKVAKSTPMASTSSKGLFSDETSDDDLFKVVKKPQVVNFTKIFKKSNHVLAHVGNGVKHGVKHSFRCAKEGILECFGRKSLKVSFDPIVTVYIYQDMSRTPGRLNINQLGGKLNTLLLNGPGPIGKKPASTAPAASAPTPTAKANHADAGKITNQSIAVMKSRARGPANRRPPTRLTSANAHEQTADSAETIEDPLGQ